ncbi:MAG: T9SS type A sorting domain-containing protein, partial [Chitinophagaceae bacterium]|nr:T9SS type A sorting domain-containing protein [Chitinophagaceae bacterium]
FEVFPNPASDNISIRTGKDIAIEKVAIYSVNGVKLIEEILPFRKNETTLDAGPLPPGFYFVHLSTSAGTGIRKIQVM